MEAGWIALRIHLGLIDAPADQLNAMRNAYFAGAQHLYASMMTVFDDGVEPTDADMERMASIHHELEEWAKIEKLRHAETKGTG
jgi:hypothetical protein